MENNNAFNAVPEADSKVCTVCRELLPLSRYSKEKRNTSKGIRAQCKTCQYREVRNRRIASYQGMSREAYDEMLKKQNYGCAICGGRDDDRELAVDHDHETKQVRGLLCGKHNMALGLLSDSPVLCGRAANYLWQFVTTPDYAKQSGSSAETETH